MLRFLFAILLILGCESCRDSSQQKSEIEHMLERLAAGERPTEFAGHEGQALQRIRAKRAAQRAPLSYDIREGDASVGDGSCSYHAFIFTSDSTNPFIAIRLKHQHDGWHIAGFWTPT